jgi:hypothetical protein
MHSKMVAKNVEKYTRGKNTTAKALETLIQGTSKARRLCYPRCRAHGAFSSSARKEKKRQQKMAAIRAEQQKILSRALAYLFPS